MMMNDESRENKQILVSALARYSLTTARRYKCGSTSAIVY